MNYRFIGASAVVISFCLSVLSANAQPAAPSPASAPVRPRLGVKLMETDEPGAAIMEVMSGYAAETSGLQAGDRVVKIGTDDVPDVQSFRDTVTKLHDGDSADFHVIRDGKEVVVNVKMVPPRPDAPGAKPPTMPQLRDELLAMMEKDQADRIKMMEGKPSKEEQEEIVKRMTDIDATNRERLKQIIAEHGYPTISMVGEQAAQAAFLIVQHGDRDLKWQEQMLPTFEKLAEKGEVLKSSVAYLTDRILRAHDKPQLYGTQVYQEPGLDGQLMFVAPVVEDPQNLDKRRMKMGMRPWSQYDAQLARMQNRESFKSPRSPEEARARTTAPSTRTTP